MQLDYHLGLLLCISTDMDEVQQLGEMMRRCIYEGSFAAAADVQIELGGAASYFASSLELCLLFNTPA